MTHWHWLCLAHLAVFAIMAGGITYKKGRGWWLGAFWGLLLGIFGVIAMMFVRSRRTQEEEEQDPMSPQSLPTDNYGRAKF